MPLRMGSKKARETAIEQEIKQELQQKLVEMQLRFAELEPGRNCRQSGRGRYVGPWHIAASQLHLWLAPP